LWQRWGDSSRRSGEHRLVHLGELLWLIAPPLCWGCDGPEPSGAPLCRECRARLRWVGRELVAANGVDLWAPLAYEGPARALVQGLKFHGAARLAETMAAQIVANAPAGLLERRALVPVPLHPARRRRRGYNQAERLASALSKRTSLPLLDCLERRGRGGATQMGRGREQRLAGIEGTVWAKRGATVPRRAVIVDDVVTTGATLRACAEALRTAGANTIRAVAYTRTPGR
jgi:ComF family protein